MTTNDESRERLADAAIRDYAMGYPEPDEGDDEALATEQANDEIIEAQEIQRQAGLEGRLSDEEAVALMRAFKERQYEKRDSD